MLLETKSLLAKLMATENLTVEQRNTKTAYFDTENRVLIIPVLDNKIPAHTYDLFMGHEVGHALYTPQKYHDTLKEHEIPHGLWNVIEDSRIERKIKYKYPGLKNSFNRGYKDLLGRNFFGIDSVNINKLNFVDRINMHCKGGALLNVSFTEEERTILKEVESTETFEDVLVVCKKIKDFVKEQIEEQSKQSITIAGENDDEDSDYDDDPSGENSTGDEEDDTGESEKTGKEQSDSKNVSEEESEESEQKSTKSEDDALRSFTDENYRENEYKLFSDDGSTRSYANIPKIDVEKCIVNYKKVYEEYKNFKVPYYISSNSVVDLEGFQKIRKEINTSVSYLVKEFELRKNAEQLKRASIAKTGELNVDKIYSYKFNDDIFKKVTVVPGGKSHGLVIYLDWSGSMANHLEPTIKQLFNIVMFCKKVNIPYEVYSFTDGNHSNQYRPKMKHDDLYFNSFKLLNLLSSRMSASEFTYAASALVWLSKNIRQNGHPDIMWMGGTPLNEAMISAMEIIPHFQKKYKLQVVNTIFLTDGEGDFLYGKWDMNSVQPQVKSYRYNNHFPYKKEVIVIRDPVTHNQEEITNISDRNRVTSSFVKLLKQRTKCNVVGFYILSPSEFKSFARNHYQSMGVNTEELRVKFNKDNCAVITNAGFDEYYLLRSKKTSPDDGEPEIKVKENATVRGLVSAFTKYTGKRNTNRVVLNRFINMIA